MRIAENPPQISILNRCQNNWSSPVFFDYITITSDKGIDYIKSLKKLNEYLDNYKKIFNEFCIEIDLPDDKSDNTPQLFDIKLIFFDGECEIKNLGRAGFTSVEIAPSSKTFRRISTKLKRDYSFTESNDGKVPCNCNYYLFKNCKVSLKKIRHENCRY